MRELWDYNEDSGTVQRSQAEVLPKLCGRAAYEADNRVRYAAKGSFENKLAPNLFTKMTMLNPLCDKGLKVI